MTKNDDRAYQRSATLLTIGVVAFLMICFGKFFPHSGDLAQHYLLVDEIMKHGGVRPGPPPNIGFMALYPPIAHWLAATVGWIGGSGLVGMVVMAIGSVFAAYVLIGHLLGATSPVRMVLFLAVFALLLPSRSLIGWEVVVNFFYPQLVADVVYLAVLLWLSKEMGRWERIALILVIGTLTLWIQPVVAIHVFGAGLTFVAFQSLHSWVTTKKIPATDMLVLFAAVALSMAAIWLNPAFKDIQANARHDGYLEFGYSHVLWVAVVCGALGAASLTRRLRGRGDLVDSVLGSACIAATVLVMLQYAVLKLHGDGSIYAVKKHMFITLTLGAMNAVRLIASFVRVSGVKLPASRLAIPIISGMASWAALADFNKPVAPVVRAINYANDAAQARLPQFVPGNTVFVEGAESVVVKYMITLSAFEYPFDKPSALWLLGQSFNHGAQYSMVRRSRTIDSNCHQRFAESATYVVIESECLRIYTPGDVIKFGLGGNGHLFKTGGWSTDEPWGSWILGNESAGLSMILPEGSKGPFTMSVEAMAPLTGTHPRQVVDVSVNGQKVSTWTYFMSDTSPLRSIEIPPSLIKDSTLHIEFHAVDAVVPANDSRALGLGMKQLTIAPK